MQQTKWTVTHPCQVIFTVDTRRQCVCCYSVWLSFSLYASLRISIRLLGECQQDASQGGDTWGEGEQRQRHRDGGEKGRWGATYQSWNTGENVGVEWEVIYILSHAESSFTPSLCAGAGRLIGLLAVLINNHWQICIDRFTMIVTCHAAPVTENPAVMQCVWNG